MSGRSMGCKVSLPCLRFMEGGKEEEEQEEPRQYSWDLARQTLDLSQFTIDRLVDGETGRRPGSISGQQFQIKNCNNSHIYLFDWSNTVTVDDCINCKIFIGPVKGSVFIRDCTNCVVVVACGQFRTRDCRNLDAFLCVNTQPIIEASSRVRVGCLQYSYPGIKEQMESAEVSPWNNHWWNIHDFSPVEGGSNWARLGQMFKVQDFLPLPEDSSVRGVDVSTVPSKSYVPRTAGPTRDKALIQESCLIAVFWSEKQEQVARGIIGVLEGDSGVELVRTCKMAVRREDAERVFQRWGDLVIKGQVICLELRGPGCLSMGASNAGPCVGTSKDQHQAESDLQGLWGLAEMQMGF